MPRVIREPLTELELAALLGRAERGEVFICTGEGFELPADVVHCSSCLTPLTKIDIASHGYLCPLCGSSVCVICGCTTARACEGGCSWIGAGICSTHEAELQQAVRQVFGV